MQKDSAVRTLLVAVLLCIVCSVMVTSAAVVLRDKQEKNKQLDVKKNLENGYVISTGLGWGGGVMKLDANGDTLWTKQFDNLSNIYSVDNTTDSGYVAAGFTNNPGDHIVVIKLNSSGNILWSNYYTINSYRPEIKQTSDGGYIISSSKSISSTTSSIFLLKLVLLRHVSLKLVLLVVTQLSMFPLNALVL